MAYALTDTMESRIKAMWQKLPEPRPSLAETTSAIMDHGSRSALDAAEKLSPAELAAQIKQGPRNKSR